MAAFSDLAFKAKLKDLNSTQQSIQTISLWAIHHRRHDAKVVAIWMEELREAKDAGRKLTLLYFANDVVQNMRKKGQEYQAEFQNVLVEAFTNASRQARLEGQDKILKSLGRLATVWRERAIFNDAFVTKLEQALVESEGGSGTLVPATVPVGQPSVSRTPPLVEDASFSKRIKIDTAEFQAFSKADLQMFSKADFQAFSKASQNSQLGGKGRLEPHSDDEDYEELPYTNGTDASQSPKLETLLRLIQKLQSAPSANGTIRSKIAQLPGIITDPAAIDQISDPAEIERLVGVAKDGLQVVMEYNKELNEELLDRQAVAAELARQLAFHRKIIDEKEHLREELAQQISERRAFRDKLAIHVDSLPDMSRVSGLSGAFTLGRNTAAPASKASLQKGSLYK